MEGWKKITSVEKCLNDFKPGVWKNLKLDANVIKCNVQKGIGIVHRLRIKDSLSPLSHQFDTVYITDVKSAKNEAIEM